MSTICICTNCSMDIGGKRPGDDAKCPSLCSFCSKESNREFLKAERLEIKAIGIEIKNKQ